MGAFSNRAIGRTLLCLLPIVSMTFGGILRNEDAMNRAFQIGRSLEKLENVGGISDYVELFSELLEEMRNDIASRAEQALQQGLAKVQKDYNVSSLCLNHTKLLFEGLVERQDWAFRSK